MAIVGLNLAATEDYSSRYDSDAKAGPGQVVNPTVFRLGTLDSFVFAHIRDKLTVYETSPLPGAKGNVRVSANEMAIETVRYGLRGWRNLKDGQGNDIPFRTVKQYLFGREYDAVADECLMVLPLQLVLELSERLKMLNELSEAEAGNSKAA
jgi:hypothetical protein